MSVGLPVSHSSPARFGQTDRLSIRWTEAIEQAPRDVGDALRSSDARRSNDSRCDWRDRVHMVIVGFACVSIVGGLNGGL